MAIQPQSAPAALPEKGVLLDARPEADESDPHDALRKAKRVKIKVHRTGAPHEANDVYVGVNGVGFLLQRGVEASVPEPVAHVLDNAIQTVYHKTVIDGKEVLVASEVPAYPFTRLH